MAIEGVARVVVDRALASDAAAIKPMVDAAYAKYVGRMGRLPAAMTADYRELIATGRVDVLRVDGEVVGSILLERDGDAIMLGNLVVDPSAQGRGYGRVLMDHAEAVARAQGLSAVTLFTNEAMHENLALYAKRGFVETARRTEDGFKRVFFRKTLG